MTDTPNAQDDDAEDDLSGYLQIYLDETEEQLDELVDTMLVLENHPSDASSLNAAFRLLHSMKGAAGMMGFDQITVLTHHLETRFERLRSGRIELDRNTMNLTLRCIDFLRQCNDRQRDGQELSTPDVLLEELRVLEEAAEKELERRDEPAVSDLVARSTQVESADAESDDAESADAESADAESADAESMDAESDDAKPAAGHPSDAAGDTGSLHDETDAEQGSAPEGESDVSPATRPGTGNQPYQLPDLGTDYHVIVTFADHLLLKDFKAKVVATAIGNLGEIKATRPELEDGESAEDFTVFDIIVNTTDPPGDIIQRAQTEGVARIEVRMPRDAESEPLAVWAPPTTTPPTTTPPSSPSGDSQPAADTDRDDKILSPPKPVASLSPEPVDAKAGAGAKINETMRVDIDRLDTLMNLAGELVVNRAQFIQVSGEIGPGLRKSNNVAKSREFCDTLAGAIELLKTQAEAPESSLHGDVAKWSATIGELESGLELIREQSRLWENGRRCFSRLDEAIDQLSRVSDSLQRGVLGTRMVPVGPLFSRFKRVVRDLTQDGNKTVQLEIDGEATELDKRMIDALGDPMVHLVRNSIDHGLESTERRLAVGKPAAGTVALSARHRGNHVTILVRDDGAGIDADVIRNRLVSKGLMTAEAAAALSDNDAVASIFLPGFSTAEKVTDISGRGVGMDIVKARIEELSGTIEIDTVPGEGTTFTLKLPLTLAIIGSLLVRIRGVVFAIPKDDVREIVSIARKDIVTVGGKQTFEVRGQYTSLVCVEELFRWNGLASGAVDGVDDGADHWAASGDDEVEIAILQSGGRPMGLRVDQSIGSQDVVIKSLADNFIGLPGLAGASILGDGTVSLMLDVAELHKMASR